MKNREMNITINKEYTTLAEAESVKKQIKEFAKYNTPEMILAAFNEAFPRYYVCGNTVLVCNMEAFQIGENKNRYQVYMVVDSGYAFDRLNFYIDQNMQIDKRPGLHSADHYRLLDRKN